MLFIQLNGTTDSHKFVNEQQTVTISSTRDSFPSLLCKKSIGSVSCKIVHVLRTRPITLSTCIRTDAIFLVDSTSNGESWLLPCVNAGISTSAHTSPTLSDISKPLSAKTTSPGKSLDRRPHFSVMFLSLALPPQPFNKKDTAPSGIIPIKYFIALWCL